jgi:formate/nitrite transporter
MTTFGAWTYTQSCYKLADVGVSRVRAHWSEYLVRTPPSGIFMVFSFLFGAIGQSDSSQRFLFGFGFSLGLMFIVLTQCFLWTGDVMYISVAWMTRRITLVELLRTWAIVYTGNVVGSIGGAYLCGPCTGIVLPGSRYANAVIQTALNKVTIKPMYMLTRGLVGNWLICIANHLAVMNKTFTGKVLAIALGITCFGTIGYDHAVANWNILTMAKVIQPSAFSWTMYFECCILTTLGNLLGGVLLMAFPATLTIYLDKFYYNKPKPAAPPAPPKAEDEVELEDGPFDAGTPPLSVPHTPLVADAAVSPRPSAASAGRPSRASRQTADAEDPQPDRAGNPRQRRNGPKGTRGTAAPGHSSPSGSESSPESGSYSSGSGDGSEIASQ